ncbi:MAG TPA: NUDIX hydrolase [Anaerolineaceae bacterium]
MEQHWLEWGQRLQAIAQDGIAYSQNPFDIERFEQVRRIAAELLAAQTGAEIELLVELFAAEKGYATPKVDVRGAAFRGEEILLVRELLDGGRWTLPGGWADPGDAPGEAAAREMREESGYEARPVKLAAVYDRERHGHPRFYFSIYKLFFICEITGGAPAQSLETGGAEFFAEDALPELSIGRVTEPEIHMLFRHYRDPRLPTEFD